MGHFTLRFKGTVAVLEGLPLPESLEVTEDGEYVKLVYRSDDSEERLLVMSGLSAVISRRLGVPDLIKVK